MARLPRIILPGHPLHLIQRGNNRQACFFSAADRLFYLECLAEAAIRHGCLIHAYVLMTNHVHLLVTPETERSVSSMLQSVGRSYVRHVNATYRRSGTLWEGRYKSALIESERYLLACSRYIELNPVRAGMVKRPGEYRWSSYARNGLGRPNALVSPHSVYQRLGHSDEERQAAYQALFAANADEQEETAELRHATAQGVVLGNDRFRAEIEATLGRRVNKHQHGGDRKSRAFREQHCAGGSSSTLTP